MNLRLAPSDQQRDLSAHFDAASASQPRTPSSTFEPLSLLPPPLLALVASRLDVKSLLRL